MIRSFVALDLPENLSDRLLSLADRCPVGRPTPEENLHLTLAFLGDQEMWALEELDGELSRLRLPPVKVSLKGLDLFGPRLGVLAARAEPTADLLTLHDRVMTAIRRAGLTTERRRFRPHVTLVRLNEAGPAERAKLQAFLVAQAAFGPLDFTAQNFTLYRSTLNPKGARHDILAEYDLTDGA